MKYWRLFRYLWNSVKCQLRHGKSHNDVQWELISMGLAARTMGNGDFVPATPHLWRVWTGCNKCGMGWCHTVAQEVSGIDSWAWGSSNDPLPQNPDAVFRTPDGSNPRENN